MRIFNIMLSRELGGIQESFLSYNQALKIAGHEVYNITSYFAKINSFVKNYISLPCLCVWCPVSVLYLKYLIYKCRPDIIIAHGRRAVSFSYYVKTHSIPVIGVTHNYKNKHLIKKCDYLIALTRHLKESVICTGANADKVKIIPNMIDVKLTYAALKYDSSKTVTIGTMGRFVAKKGFDNFIYAIKILCDKGLDIKVIIGGEGEEESKLKELSFRLGLSDVITFIGWVQDKDKARFWNDIDIFCIPSKHEPFGIIVLEAMHHSCPIISSNSEGPSEILEDKKDALIFDKNSIEEMSWCLEKLIVDVDEASRYSKSAYNKLKDRYDTTQVSNMLDSFLKTVHN